MTIPQPALYLDFTHSPTVTDPRVLCTRSTTATFTGQNGLIQTSFVNQARIDFDAVTGTNLGLLIEEARTNVCLQSEDLGTTWTLNGSPAPTLSTNAATAPDGATTADEVTFGSSSGSSILQSVTANTSANTEYTLSVWAKIASGTGQFRLSVWDDVSGNQTGSDLTVTTTWTRFTHTATYGVGSTSRSCVLRNASDSGTDVILFWGAQLEAGSFPTSYIPTTTTSVARTADVVTMNNMAWFNAGVGTVFVDYTFPVSPGANAEVLEFVNGSGTELIEIVLRGDLSPDVNMFRVNDGGVVQAQLNGSIALVANTSIKVAAAWAANDFAVSYDGAAVLTDVSGTLPTITEFVIGSHKPGINQYLNGHIENIQYWQQRLPNADLQTIST